MGEKIYAKIGQVLEANLYIFPKKVTLIKAKLCFNIKKSLKPDVHIGIKKEGNTWIDFRYEKIHMFCFSCGIIGHNEEFSPKDNMKNLDPNITNPFGPWLRSIEFGKRIKDET